MKKITHDIFKSARELISKGWTRDWYARDANGNEVSPKSEEAVSFCALGALRISSEVLKDWRCPSGYEYLIVPAIEELFKFIPPNFISIHAWNDSCNSVEEVLAVFDKALDQPIED